MALMTLTATEGAARPRDFAQLALVVVGEGVMTLSLSLARGRLAIVRT